MGKASGHGKVRGLESNRLGNPVGLALGLRVSSVAGLGWLCRDSQAVVRLGLRCPGGREGVSSQCQPVLSTILFTLVLLRPPSASVSLGADVYVVFGESAHQIRLKSQALCLPLKPSLAVLLPRLDCSQGPHSKCPAM